MGWDSVRPNSRVCLAACIVLASVVLAGTVVGIIFGVSSGTPVVSKKLPNLAESADGSSEDKSVGEGQRPGGSSTGSDAGSSLDLPRNSPVDSSNPAYGNEKPAKSSPTTASPPPIPKSPQSVPAAGENRPYAPSTEHKPQPQAVQTKGSWKDKPRSWRYPAQAKRGICWQFDDWKRERPMQPFDRIAWTKNWKLSPDVGTAQYFADQGVEFVPMLWSKYTLDDMEAAIPKDARNLLVLNEPNHIGQAATWPKEAAAMWPKIEAVARSKGLLLGSPSVSPCGSNDYIAPKYADPFVWMDDFLDHCQGCKMDFMAVHYYVCNVDWLKGYLYQFYQRYKRPVWLTEFACPFGDPLRTKALLEDFMEWADAQSWLHRYSWFTLKVDDYVWLGGGNNLMDYAQLKLTPLGYTYNTYTGSKVASSSVGGNSLAFNSSEEVILSWSQGCGHCASLSANATVEEKAFCSFDCGFWDKPVHIKEDIIP